MIIPPSLANNTCPSFCLTSDTLKRGDPDHYNFADKQGHERKKVFVDGAVKRGIFDLAEQKVKGNHATDPDRHERQHTDVASHHKLTVGSDVSVPHGPPGCKACRQNKERKDKQRYAARDTRADHRQS